MYEQPQTSTANQPETNGKVFPKIENESEPLDQGDAWNEDNEQALAQDMEEISALLQDLEKRKFPTQSTSNNSTRVNVDEASTQQYLEDHYACPYDGCDKQFMDEEPLIVHLRSHTGQVFQCPFCSKMFQSKANFNDHLEMHKADNNRFECSCCKRKFSSKNHLNRHLKLSCKEKRFRCCYCQEKYTNRCYLYRHIRMKHAKKRRDIECLYCETKCATLGQLNSHLGTHK